MKKFILLSTLILVARAVAQARAEAAAESAAEVELYYQKKRAEMDEAWERRCKERADYWEKQRRISTLRFAFSLIVASALGLSLGALSAYVF